MLSKLLARVDLETAICAGGFLVAMMFVAGFNLAWQLGNDNASQAFFDKGKIEGLSEGYAGGYDDGLIEGARRAANMFYAGQLQEIATK